MELNDKELPFELKLYLDEAGRGPLAGPVVVGVTMQVASHLDKSQFADSKKLQPKQRDIIYDEILCANQSVLFGSGFCYARIIDEGGIIRGLQSASIEAIYHIIFRYYKEILWQQLENSVWGEDHIFQIVMDNNIIANTKAKTKIQVDDGYIAFLRLFFHTPQRQFVYKGLYIDGNHTFGLDKLLGLKVQTIIKGDAKNPMIGAASIVAKVERDRYMITVDRFFPERGFAKHKGYGTKEHREQLKLKAKAKDENCLSPEHRKTFLTRIIPGGRCGGNGGN